MHGADLMQRSNGPPNQPASLMTLLPEPATSNVQRRGSVSDPSQRVNRTYAAPFVMEVCGLGTLAVEELRSGLRAGS